jgi:hypothetical protein
VPLLQKCPENVGEGDLLLCYGCYGSEYIGVLNESPTYFNYAKLFYVRGGPSIRKDPLGEYDLLWDLECLWYVTYRLYSQYSLLDSVRDGERTLHTRTSHPSSTALITPGLRYRDSQAVKSFCQQITPLLSPHFHYQFLKLWRDLD